MRDFTFRNPITGFRKKAKEQIGKRAAAETVLKNVMAFGPDFYGNRADDRAASEMMGTGSLSHSNLTEPGAGRIERLIRPGRSFSDFLTGFTALSSVYHKRTVGAVKVLGESGIYRIYQAVSR